MVLTFQGKNSKEEKEGALNEKVWTQFRFYIRDLSLSQQQQVLFN